LYLGIAVRRGTVLPVKDLRGSRFNCLKAWDASPATLNVREAPRLYCYTPQSARGPDQSVSLDDKDGASKCARSGSPEET